MPSKWRKHSQKKKEHYKKNIKDYREKSGQNYHQNKERYKDFNELSWLCKKWKKHQQNKKYYKEYYYSCKNQLCKPNNTNDRRKQTQVMYAEKLCSELMK